MKALVLGKFMPLHNGHLALFRFARKQGTTLTVLLCHHPGEPIPGAVRLRWLQETLGESEGIEIKAFEYDTARLSPSSEASEEAARDWADAIRTEVPGIDVFVSSEAYGPMVARYLGIRHLAFDPERQEVPVSASAIRRAPLRYWAYLPPAVRPYYLKKVVLLGTESTGKSTLAERLALHFHTLFVPEMARFLIGRTQEVCFEDLERIAEAQAKAILEKERLADRVLFIDTDVNITGSYARFLFGRELAIPDWMGEAQRADLYLYLEADAPFVQDGTRLDEGGRTALDAAHKEWLREAGI